MGKVYVEMSELERSMEEEFQRKVREVNEQYGYYEGGSERTTLDGEWEYSELKEELWSEAHAILHGSKDKKGWLAEHKERALRDKSLTREEFIVENICDSMDLIEEYNKECDKHRNDVQKLFGIHYFTEFADREIMKVLRGNLLT